MNSYSLVKHDRLKGVEGSIVTLYTLAAGVQLAASLLSFGPNHYLNYQSSHLSFIPILNLSFGLNLYSYSQSPSFLHDLIYLCLENLAVLHMLFLHQFLLRTYSSIQEACKYKPAPEWHLYLNGATVVFCPKAISVHCKRVSQKVS